MRKPGLWAGLLLIAHLGLVLDAARKLSPTWDEIVYPAAGLSQWRTGTLHLNTEHPFLSKLIGSAPLLLLNPSLPVDDPSWTARDAHVFGYRFTYQNRISPHAIIFWSRVPMVLFSVFTGLLLFLWIRSLWGGTAGVVSLLCYAATPVLLSRASAALLEMPMYFFILLALWLYHKWAENNHEKHLYACGAAAASALMCKLPALPLVPALFVMELLTHETAGSIHRRLWNIARLSLYISHIIVLMYAPWQGAWPALRHVVHNLRIFDAIIPFYWHGKVLIGAPEFLSWAAFFIKAPLVVWSLGIWGACLLWKTKNRRTVVLRWVLFSSACLLSVLFFSNAVTTIQFSPAYLGVACLAGGTGFALLKKGASRWVACALLLAALFDAHRGHPNHSAYFNSSVGGPGQGYRWLWDSDQDWGQSLPSLAKFMEEHSGAGLVMAYSGAADPRAYGIKYQDLMSPAVVSREFEGEMIPDDSQAVFLAVGTKVLQSEVRLFSWCKEHLTPMENVDSCFLVYDVSRNAEAFRWMSHVYVSINRYPKALWAARRAERLEPGNLPDQEFIAKLQKIIVKKT
ncbi:MAG: glycosyltransferase family 39 protein [Elusimicrobia bacterium]|nr:glycosyltransferase family 39 protein [Elusimicrobiota bacterium]